MFIDKGKKIASVICFKLSKNFSAAKVYFETK